MISISLSDMKLITELSTLSELQMIHPACDDLMAKYLYQIGMDCYDYPFVYLPAYHRNLQDEIVLGWRAVGEVRCDVGYRESYLADITQRLIISSYTDPSFMCEIAELAFKVRDFTEFLQESDSINFDEDRALFPQDQLEEDWESREAAVKELEDIQLTLRGSPYNSSGALKMMSEYKEQLKGKDD